MENLVTILRPAFAGHSVLVTGHTGFKGSWLCEWLLALGARVHGFALPPESSDTLFVRAGLAARMEHREGDIRDATALAQAVATIKPELVLHLAAQPLVRRSYEIPVETFATNAIGTAHLLDAVRRSGHECTVVAVTTDKVYENREWLHGYREEDPLGGYDPYSASKAATELVVASYRRSFFADGRVALASARAGNVIGGGDWAVDRIVPDCVRSMAAHLPVVMRNPGATRPWQHVLEPLCGYLLLATALRNAQTRRDTTALHRLCTAFNFGPEADANRPVRDLVSAIAAAWPGGGRSVEQPAPNAPHEAGLLHLSIDKARHLLGWKPVWPFDQTVSVTVTGYTGLAAASTALAAQTVLRDQIAAFEAAATFDVPWAR